MLKSQTKTNTVGYHPYVEYKEAELKEVEKGMMVTRVVTNALTHLKVAKRNLKNHRHTHKKVIMWEDGGVNYLYWGNHFKIYTCIKSLPCTP